MQEFSGYAKTGEKTFQHAEKADGSQQGKGEKTHPATESGRAFFLDEKADVKIKPYMEIREDERKRVEEKISKQMKYLHFIKRV